MGSHQLEADMRVPGCLWIWIVNVGSDCRKSVAANKQHDTADVQYPQPLREGGQWAFLGARRVEKKESKARSSSVI